MRTLSDGLRAEVLSVVRETLGRPPAQHETLFLAGSVADGLANSASDLDVYLVSDGPALGHSTTTRGREKNGTIGVVGDRDLNLSIVPADSLGGLREEFGRCLDSLSDPNGIVQFDGENGLKLLHRLRVGIAIGDSDDALLALCEHLYCSRLPGYLMNLHGVAAVNRLADVVGEARDGNPESASWMLREALVHYAQFLLALDGQTNPSRKWLVRMLLQGGTHAEGKAATAELLTGPLPDPSSGAAEVRAKIGELVRAPGAEAGPYLKSLVEGRA